MLGLIADFESGGKQRRFTEHLGRRLRQAALGPPRRAGTGEEAPTSKFKVQKNSKRQAPTGRGARLKAPVWRAFASAAHLLAAGLKLGTLELFLSFEL